MPINLAFKVLRLNICVPPSPDQDLYVNLTPDVMVLGADLQDLIRYGGGALTMGPMPL